MKLLLLSFVFVFHSFAAGEPDSNIYVHTMGDFDGSSLEQEGVVVKKGIPGRSLTASLPTPVEMKKLLA